jgi:hypothetical protein
MNEIENIDNIVFGKIIDYESINILKMINNIEVDNNNIPLVDCIIQNGYII